MTSATPSSAFLGAIDAFALRRCSFLLMDKGSVAGKTVTGGWFVVPGSGTGELRGLFGDGGFKAELGQHASLWLDYYFEPAR